MGSLRLRLVGEEAGSLVVVEGGGDSRALEHRRCIAVGLEVAAG
jgi:hypothetical protein